MRLWIGGSLSKKDNVVFNMSSPSFLVQASLPDLPALKRLRDDLQALAEHVKNPLSQYLREIAISRLLGHGMLPKRPEMLEAFPSAQHWCEDKEVPWVKVNAMTYSRSSEGRKEVVREE